MRAGCGVRAGQGSVRGPVKGRGSGELSACLITCSRGTSPADLCAVARVEGLKG